ncbi:hypothetical protein J2TS4_24160 [Paenibacillus sp. J2TS4]|nr:hypothetical protein J2TS4_24160 [Paenibacillus sp. J2TS4]
MQVIQANETNFARLTTNLESVEQAGYITLLRHLKIDACTYFTTMGTIVLATLPKYGIE